jgi:dTDP-D-glucose 4,6-dehydratase
VERLYDEVGWRPQFGLHDAIADTISWWRQKTVGDDVGVNVDAIAERSSDKRAP